MAFTFTPEDIPATNGAAMAEALQEAGMLARADQGE